MQNELSLLRKVRFCVNTGVIYLLTVAFAWYAAHPLPSSGSISYVSFNTVQQPRPPASGIKEVSGIPVRLVIPDSSYAGTVVDLPVDKGYYDQATDSWTLSGYHAQFMIISSPANNISGETYIYGHNNDYVFGALRHVTPAVGAKALIYTDNGHIFSYAFQGVINLAPGDTSVLDYSGPPIMVIQTCTGSLNEWRTDYKFTFSGIVQ